MFQEKYTVAATISINDEKNGGRPMFMVWAVPKGGDSSVLIARMAILEDGYKHLTFHAPGGEIIADYPTSFDIDDGLTSLLNTTWDGDEFNLSGKLATVMASLVKTYDTAAAVAPILEVPIMSVMMMLASSLPGVSRVTPINSHNPDQLHHHEETKQ